uniref:Uncharacterized protein n=1 Tax=Thermosporothrix sp. COM3 TaxID=2490863 RepID=A0A455SJI6_9CHLR|nr:hypothetical protein KTC_18330 [Thermosporothrix sp. COM3]
MCLAWGSAVDQALSRAPVIGAVHSIVTDGWFMEHVSDPEPFLESLDLRIRRLASLVFQGQ